MIGPSSISTSCQIFIQTAWTSTKELFQRIWNAVSNFFQYLADKIHSAYTWLTGTSKPKAEIRLHDSRFIQEKLAPYQNMPQDPAQFMKKSIELYREFLKRKDQRLAQSLESQGIDTTEEIADDQKPNQLQVFNEQFEGLEEASFVKTAIACVRAFVFSNSDQRFSFFRKFANWTDFFWVLKALQDSFLRLEPKEKEILLEIDDCKNLSEKTKSLYKRMMKIANELVQGCAEFNNAYQQARELLQSPSDFVKTAIENYRILLPDKRRAQFDQDLKTCSNYPEVIVAILREYVFSGSAKQFDFFKKKIDIDDGVLEELRDHHGHLIHAGGPQYRAQEKDYTPDLRALQAEFQRLSEYQQQELVKMIDPDQLKTLPYHERHILREISNIANSILTNQTLAKTIQSALE